MELRGYRVIRAKNRRHSRARRRNHPARPGNHRLGGGREGLTPSLVIVSVNSSMLRRNSSTFADAAALAAARGSMALASGAGTTEDAAAVHGIRRWHDYEEGSNLRLRLRERDRPGNLITCHRLVRCNF